MVEKNESQQKTVQQDGSVSMPAAGSEVVVLTPEAFDRFTNAFELAAKRWERIVYPSMAVVLLMFVYGFYLVLSLASEMRLLASRFDPDIGERLTTVAESIDKLPGSIDRINEHMLIISASIPDIDSKMAHMSELPQLRTQMDEISTHMATMSDNIILMNQELMIMNDRIFWMTGDIADINRSVEDVGRPMSYFNRVMPW